MPISGTFQTSERYVGYRPRDNTRNWGVGVEPDHGDRNTPDPGTPAPAPVPRLEGPPFLEDMVDVSRTPPYFPDADTETAPYDRADQHDAPTLPWGVRDNDRLRRLSGALHAAQKRVFPYQAATKVDRDYTTRNETRREQSLPPSPAAQGGPISGQALRALRGRNSLPVNNPGDPLTSFSGNYVRQGWNISRITNRRMARRGLSHTKRELHLNLATTATERPGMPGPYASPFSSVPVASVGPQRPATRREPRPWDEDQVEDFAADTGPSGYVSWGL